MDGWGSLTVLLKRQNTEKYRKAKLRHELQKRKESLFKRKKEYLDFPEISKSELEFIKNQIKANYRKERIKNIGINVLLLVISFLLIFYIITSMKIL